MGRKKKEFNQLEFENLCKILCTHEEIANVFGTTKDTLYRWVKRTYGEDISIVYKRFSDEGRASIRRMQFKSAEKGNVTMQIFLGKQLLGQSDKVVQKIDTTSNDEAIDNFRKMIEEARDEETNN